MISNDWLDALHAAAHAVVALRLGVNLEQIEGHEYSFMLNKLRELYPESITLNNPYDGVFSEGKEGADKLMTVLCSTSAIGPVLGIQGFDNEDDLRSIEKLKAACTTLDVELDPVDSYTEKSAGILQKPENRILVHVIADRLMNNDTLWMQRSLMLMMDYPGINAKRQKLVNASFENDSFEWEIQTVGYLVMSACLGLDNEYAMLSLRRMVQDGLLADVDVYTLLDNQAFEDLLLVYFAGYEAFHVMGVETASVDEYVAGAQDILDRALAHGLQCDLVESYRLKAQAIFNEQKNKFVLHLLLGYFIMNPELFQKDEDGIMTIPDSKVARYLHQSLRLDAEKAGPVVQKYEKDLASQ